MINIIIGFEKRADERTKRWHDEQRKDLARAAQEKERSVGKESLRGAGKGGAIGSAIGAAGYAGSTPKGKRGKAALLGAAVGGLGGAAAGYGSFKERAERINRERRIGKQFAGMGKSEQKKYLAKSDPFQMGGSRAANQYKGGTEYQP